jgi:hypothetical protein
MAHDRKMKQKVNKQGGDFGPRLVCTICWSALVIYAFLIITQEQNS